MMALTLPPRPSLDWLRKTAKDHLRELRNVRPESALADAVADAIEHGARLAEFQPQENVRVLLDSAPPGPGSTPLYGSAWTKCAK